MEGAIENSELSPASSAEARRGNPVLFSKESTLCATGVLLTSFVGCVAMGAICVGVAHWRVSLIARGIVALTCGLMLGISMMLFMVFRITGCCNPALLLRINSSVEDESVLRFRDTFSPKCWKGMLRSGTRLTFTSRRYSWHVVKKGIFPRATCIIPGDDMTAAIRLPRGYIKDRFGGYQQFKDVVKRAENVVIVFPKQKSASPVLMFGLRIGTRADILRVMSGCNALSSGFGSAFFANYVCIYKHLLFASSVEQVDSCYHEALVVSREMRSLSHREIANVLTDVACNKELFLAVSKFWSKNSGGRGSDEVQTLKALLKLVESTKLRNRLGSIKESNPLKDNLSLLALVYALLPEKSRCFVSGAVDGAVLRKRLSDFLKKCPEIRYVAACMDYTIGDILCERFQDAGYSHSRCFRVFGLLFHSSITVQQIAKLYEDDLEACMAAFYDFPILTRCGAYAFMARRFMEETGMDLGDAVHAHNVLRSDRASDGGVTKRASSMLYHMCDALGFQSLTYEALSTVIATSILRLYADTLESAHMGEVLYEYSCQAEIPALYNWRCASMISGYQHEIITELTPLSVAAPRLHVREQGLPATTISGDSTAR
ncbi:hypothetical protein [Anaplasma centrale]|nr:hypothetical protein [Anaplasma centrale]